DSLNTIEFDRYYIILPSTFDKNTINTYLDKYNAKMVAEGFQYNSGMNQHWLDVDQLREEIKMHVDPSFQVF
ncbi:MAG: UDP-N-acetylglucosamine 4,6-dehydratase (inverting), partial [Flavobacterium sp.]|nr:UDP-N-acetylglucosamine 4,6-dehydratase (inverting) [Flavobacterium sp.]